MKILHDICSIPTAPFAEDRVMRYVDDFVRARQSLSIRKDKSGNRLITLPGKTKSPRVVFVAHTDHPGLIARKMIDAKTLDADFRGGVLKSLVDGARVRFFDGANGLTREITGTIIKTATSKDRPHYPSRATVRVSQAIAPGSPGMFDQGTSRVKNGKFLSRVCDDLAGAASVLTMLDTLLESRTKLGNNVCVLLTRAEEDGFIGAIATVLDKTLLRKDDRMISIECSAEQPYAQQGNGVIIRVGDRTSVFDSSLTYFLTQQAEQLAKRDRKFKFQRALMPGGSCEGTVFDAYGYITSAACVPLRNYHNMDRVNKKIAPEIIDLTDWNNMVKLFVDVARNAHEFDPNLKPLKSRLENRFNKLKRFL